ncbi:MAG: queuosine biosynthesis protein [Aquifex sp.]|nr:MAG: queuosine biosynthesis protein [Aquifex sp.]
MKKEKIVVLFSGGVESTALLIHYASKNNILYPLYVRFGYSWEDEELKRAKNVLFYLKKSVKNLRNLATVKVKSLSKRLKGFPSTEKELEIPMRNLLLCSQAAIYGYRKGIFRCAIGSLGMYPFPDNKREYFDKLEELISQGLNKTFTIETPFFGMKKEEIIRLYGNLMPLHLTFSCIKPIKGKPCGKCIKCREREEALRLL